MSYQARAINVNDHFHPVGVNDGSAGLSIECLVEDHGEFLKKFIRRRTWDDQYVDDIYQTTLLEAFLSLNKFRGDSQPRTWLCGIAFNVIRNHARKTPTATMEPVEVLDSQDFTLPECAYGTEDPSAICAREDMTCEVQKQFDALSKSIKETFNEVVNLGKSYEETADKLKIPIGTVRSRIARARQIFRERCSI